MCGYLDLVKLLTARFHDRILRSCAPIFECFNLEHFWYYKITNTGHFSFFDTDIAWCEYYGSEKLYLQHPYLRHPDIIKPGVYLLHHKKPTQENYGFNFKTELQIITRTPNGIESFGFVSKDKESSPLVFINEINMFHLFIHHLKKENRIIFKCLEDNLIDLSALIGASFYKNDVRYSLPKEKRRIFLEHMGIDHSLTVREKEIIKLLLEGYPASKIAAQIFRSSRTVEHHIERIKQKLNCFSRAELFQKAKELDLIGALISW